MKFLEQLLKVLGVTSSGHQHTGFISAPDGTTIRLSCEGGISADEFRQFVKRCAATNYLVDSAKKGLVFGNAMKNADIRETGLRQTSFVVSGQDEAERDRELNFMKATLRTAGEEL